MPRAARHATRQRSASTSFQGVTRGARKDTGSYSTAPPLAPSSLSLLAPTDNPPPWRPASSESSPADQRHRPRGIRKHTNFVRRRVRTNKGKGNHDDARERKVPGENGTQLLAVLRQTPPTHGRIGKTKKRGVSRSRAQPNDREEGLGSANANLTIVC
jgi:hypothetical protein